LRFYETNLSSGTLWGREMAFEIGVEYLNSWLFYEAGRVNRAALENRDPCL